MRIWFRYQKNKFLNEQKSDLFLGRFFVFVYIMEQSS